MANDLFTGDPAVGCVYRQVGDGYNEDEPLYVFKLYGNPGADVTGALAQWAQQIAAREQGGQGRREFKLRNIRFFDHHGGGLGSVSAPLEHLELGLANLLRSKLGGRQLDAVYTFQLSVFRPKLRGRPMERTAAEALEEARRAAERPAPTVDRLTSRQRELLRLTEAYGGNYTQAAQELGIPFSEAVGVVMDHLKN